MPARARSEAEPIDPVRARGGRPAARRERRRRHPRHRLAAAAEGGGLRPHVDRPGGGGGPGRAPGHLPALPRQVRAGRRGPRRQAVPHPADRHRQRPGRI